MAIRERETYLEGREIDGFLANVRGGEGGDEIVDGETRWGVCQWRGQRGVVRVRGLFNTISL